MTTKHGDFFWHELATPDTEAAKPFYSKLFGWGHREVPTDAGEYSIWTRNDSDHGGLLKMEGPEWANISPHWMVYFRAVNVDDAAAKVVDLGGEISVPPTDIPDVGRFCVVKDPSGAVLSMMTPVEGMDAGQGRD